MKTTGFVWNEYLASWPDGQWLDDSDETINGRGPDDFIEIPATAVVEFSAGVVFKDEGDVVGKSLVSHFRAWLKQRDSVTLMVTVGKEHEQQLLAFVKSIKGKTQ